MMTDLHYDDEKIIAFLHSEHLDSDVRRDPHLKSCALCADTLAEYRIVASTLGVEAVWDLRELKYEELVPSTIASLRAFSDDMAREDAEAETYVARLLEGPREWWSNKLRQNPHYRTAGVVRKLIEANDRAIDTMPPDAVAITALAVDIAESLDIARYPSDTVMKLRGAAWRERGFALFYTGCYKEAPEAVDRAEAAFRRCAVADYELARVGILRAFTYRPLDRITEGVALARASAAEFSKFGDRGRVASARFAEVNLLLKLQDYRSALPQLLAIEREFDDVMANDGRARLTENIAYCYRELGMVEQALQAAQIAIEMFTALETPTELARAEWLVAGLLAAQGKTADAQPRFQKVLRAFERLGMSSAAALVRLDLCELLVLEQRFTDVEQMARVAMSAFEASGLEYTPRALTAISLLREAAQQKRATPTLAREVRRYIRELPEQPNLLFLPPPD